MIDDAKPPDPDRFAMKKSQSEMWRDWNFGQETLCPVTAQTYQ
jgi:hypothetical protein